MNAGRSKGEQTLREEEQGAEAAGPTNLCKDGYGSLPAPLASMFSLATVRRTASTFSCPSTHNLLVYSSTWGPNSTTAATIFQAPRRVALYKPHDVSKTYGFAATGA